MTFVILASAAVLLLAISWQKSKDKTKESCTFAFRMLKQSGPTLLVVLALVSLFLSYLPPQSIQRYIGSPTLLSVLIGGLTGTVTILPGFVAFPLAASLLERGAFVGAISAFITTLTMVGFATLPLEIRYFGKRFALVRNSLSFVLALIIAGGMMLWL